MSEKSRQPYEVGVQDVRFNRGLTLLAFGGGVYLAITATSRLIAGRTSFSTGLAVSMAFTLLVASGYLAWCWRLMVRNLGRPTDWFRDRDRRVQPWSEAVIFGVGPLLALATVFLYVGGSRFVSGLLVAPACLLLLIVLARVTGNIQPL